ncbi:MAG: PAS domain S-box protein, partial [Lutibacter sp.]
MKNLFQLNIAKRIALPFFFILLMMVVTIILTTKSYNAPVKNHSLQREVVLKQGVIANLWFSVSTLIMHTHDFIITEKADYNHLFKLQRIQVEDYQKKLQAFKLSKEELIIVDAIISDLDSVYLYSNQIFAIQNPGSSSDATKLMEIMDDNFETPLYQNITNIFNLSTHKVEVLTSQNTQIGEKMGNFRYIIFGLTLFISLGFVFISINKISKPIKALTKAAESISEGNYTLRPVVLSGDEIGTLALSFSKMAQTVQESLNKLKESEEQYRLLFETTSDLILTITPDGKILLVNRALREKLGYTKEDLTNLKLRNIIHNNSFSECHVVFQRALEGQRTDNVDFQLIKQSGEIIDVTGNVFCNPKEGVPSTVAYFLRDVTEQKKAEESLKLFRTLLDNSNDSIEVLDPATGCFLDINENGCKELGYSRIEFLKLSVYDIDPLVSPQSFAEMIKELRKVEFITQEGIHKRKDGTSFPVEINIRLVNLEKEYIVSLARDISLRKQSEELVLKLSSAVEQSPVSVMITDKEGNIEYVNPRVIKITGYQLNEIIGKNPQIFSSGETTKSKYEDLWNNLRAGKEWHGELLNKKKNGEFYWE